MQFPRGSFWSGSPRVRQVVVARVITALVLVLVLMLVHSPLVRAESVIATIPVGDGPYAIGVDLTTHRIYVANQNDGTVSVIDGTSNEVIETIAVGVRPSGVGVDPTTHRVYVANTNNDTVSVIDGTTNMVIATIDLDVESPVGVGVNPVTNRIYVTHQGFDKLSVIDGTNNTVITTIPVGDGPTGVAVNPTTNRIYVVNTFANTVSVVDGDTNEVIATRGVNRLPLYVAFNPETNRLYVTNSNNDSVSVIDATTNNVLDPIEVGPAPAGVGVNALTNRIYVTNIDNGTVSVIDGTTNTVIDTITVGNFPLGVGVDPTTHRVYVANVSSDTVTVLGVSPPTADARGPYTGEEGAAIPIAGDAVDADHDPLTTTWTVTPESGVDADASCSFADPNALVTTVTCSDDGTYTLTLTVDDGIHPAVVATTTVTVTNVAPTVGISRPGEGALYALGEVVELAASFADQGSNDTHTCSIAWDDGTTTTGTVSATDGDGTCTSSHAFASAGVYTVAVTVTDDDGGAVDTRVTVVVYDPSAGFVTGGGWIASPAGAYPADPEVTGKVHFNFVLRYQKGATVPSGDTKLEFKTAGLQFRGDTYQWLVVGGNGTKAQVKGTGSVNGEAGYEFLLTVYDGGKSGPDRFRMKVWDAQGTVVYDNRLGVSDDLDVADPQDIGGGSIAIHTR